MGNLKLTPEIEAILAGEAEEYALAEDFQLSQDDLAALGNMWESADVPQDVDDAKAEVVAPPRATGTRQRNTDAEELRIREAAFLAGADALRGAVAFPLMTGAPMEVGMRAAIDVCCERLAPGRLTREDGVTDFDMHDLQLTVARLYFGFYQGCYWRYDSAIGCWKQVPIEQIRRAIVLYNAYPYGEIKAGGRRTPLSVSESFTASAEKTLRDAIYRDGCQWFDAEDRELGLAMRSRFWSVGFDEAQGWADIKPEDPSPYRYQRFAYPFDWPDSTGELLAQLKYVSPLDPAWARYCPHFSRFLRSCLPDQETDARIIQEFFAASLYGAATSYQTALLLVGSGGNGKGSLMKIFKTLFPPGSVCHTNPAKWREDYHRVAIIGKLLTLMHETSAFDNPDMLKSVITGDELEGRYTGANSSAPFTFRPVAGCCFSANRLPSVKLDKALEGRFRIVVFAQEFRGKAGQIPEADLLRACKQEAPGILLWLTAGFLRLQEDGHITVSEGSSGMLTRWKHQSCPEARFLAEFVQFTPDQPKNNIPLPHLYERFRLYCEQEGLTPSKMPSRPDLVREAEARGAVEVNSGGVRRLARCKLKIVGAEAPKAEKSGRRTKA
jgi:hypothetical protein